MAWVGPRSRALWPLGRRAPASHSRLPPGLRARLGARARSWRSSCRPASGSACWRCRARRRRCFRAPTARASSCSTGGRARTRTSAGTRRPGSRARRSSTPRRSPWWAAWSWARASRPVAAYWSADSRRLTLLCPGYEAKNPAEAQIRELVNVDVGTGREAGRLALERGIAADRGQQGRPVARAHPGAAAHGEVPLPAVTAVRRRPRRVRRSARVDTGGWNSLHSDGHPLLPPGPGQAGQEPAEEPERRGPGRVARAGRARGKPRRRARAARPLPGRIRRAGVHPERGAARRRRRASCA